MAGPETIRFITTIIVIVICLSLHYFYKNRFQHNKENRSALTRYTGGLILLVSFGLAWWLMNR